MIAFGLRLEVAIIAEFKRKMWSLFQRFEYNDKMLSNTTQSQVSVAAKLFACL
jgi:hypothetical protein